MGKQSISTNSPSHYQGLDFLRGVAAIIVVMFHFSSRINLCGLFNHGYLAVDFFFVLSGFVIDRAYGDRIISGELSFKSFFVLRAVRLLPMVICGTILASLIDFFRSGDFTLAQHTFDIIVTGVLSCLLLPTFWKTTLEETTYPLNGPVWSLFFELIANICYYPFIRLPISKTLLIVAALPNLVVLVFATMHAPNTNFGTHADNFLLGFPRVFSSFAIGVLISKYNIPFKPVSKWVYAAVLFLVLACPPLPAPFDVIFNIIVISVILPLIVLGAVHCKDALRGSPLSKRSGDMSYPLYAIHYPLVRVTSMMIRHFEFPVIINYLLASLATGIFVLVGSFAFKAYDVPVRRWISRKITPLHIKAPVNLSSSSSTFLN